MKRAGRAFTESFLLHGLLAGAMIILIGFIKPPPQVIRLDFNMLEQLTPPAPKAEPKVAEAPPSSQPEPVSKPIKRPAPKPVPKTPSVAAVQPLPTPPAETPSTPAETAAQPAAGTPVADNPAGTAAEQYRQANFSAIRNAILANLQYPLLARRKGWSGKVDISFLITPDGQISELRILSSSGHPVLDEQAMEAIRRSAPFTPPRVASLLIMPVTFHLN